MPPRLSPTSELLLDSWGRRNRKHADRPCIQCGKLFRPKRSDSKYCSHECHWKNNGKNQRTVSECWWTDSKGYIQGFIRQNGRKIRVKSHRLILERHLRRHLLPSEDVHHINGDKADNRIENLVVINHGEHSRLSNMARAAIAAAEKEAQ